MVQHTNKKAVAAMLWLLFAALHVFSQNTAGKSGSGRIHLLIDTGWRFAFGHPSDTKKDFNFGTGYFSYIAKAGYGDGPAAPNFDDRAWRKLDLPHDWAVEQPFDGRASYSHGFKAIGRNFPDASVGWYRKKFTVPAEDLGRNISIAFDGVFRNSIVFVNGHYLGNEPSGYQGFEYNISEYLNYGGTNEITVRVDATMEEGWFYEGAGIYRHVWLNKTAPLHVATNGTYVTTKINSAASAIVSATVTVNNDSQSLETFDVEQTIKDADGKVIALDRKNNLILKPFESSDFNSLLPITNPKLWSVDTPYLHKLVTTVIRGGVVTDEYETTFGMRTIRFDANEGFFLNGKHLKIKGTNNHQDHAGVGSAIPDALNEYRITTLKSIGVNAYRCSHNPPTPELLYACDRLGMLVIDENRLMGVAPAHLANLKKLIVRDRNHPSVISWSIGNEEWGIENNVTGQRIAATMQAFAKSIDSTRYITAAFSGGWQGGISAVTDVVGYNYIAQENTDGHHAKYPNQPGWGTEEGSTFATRDIYFDSDSLHFKAAYDRKPRPTSFSIEEGWKHYNSRPYLAGMFIWTGFDYRGEPTPYSWPSIGSYFGMLDQCGFLKDDAWYLRSWWADKITLHLLPHWNWKGKEGQLIDVWAYSNCDEVELFLNKKSLGKKTMQKDSHLEWNVAYQPGTLAAIGYKNGKKIATTEVKTTGDADKLALLANREVINADHRDISVITVQTNDKKGLMVPTANNPVNFTITGPGKIIGVGNGDPTSLEPDQYLEKISIVKLGSLKEKAVSGMDATPETGADVDDKDWDRAFKDTRDSLFGQKVKALVYRTNFDLPADIGQSVVTLLYNSLGKEQSIYVNGKEVAHSIPENREGGVFKLDVAILHPGSNSIAILATPLLKKAQRGYVNRNPGEIQVTTPPEKWKRKLFNGLAQVIVQSTGEAGEIQLTAESEGLKPAVLRIVTK